MQHIRDIFVRPLHVVGLKILSVNTDGNLVTGPMYWPHIYVVDTSGSDAVTLTINLPAGDQLQHAARTPSGRIVFTTFNSRSVTVISDYDDVITRADLTDPQHFSLQQPAIITQHFS